MVVLSAEQNDAVMSFVNWWFDRNKKPIFTICGYAGTGKSTLIKYLMEALELDAARVAFVTFTGKASLVLRKKGHNAITIHRLIYIPMLTNYLDPSTGVPKTRVSGFTLRPEIEYALDLIVIDEVSMVSRDLLMDLLSFNIPIVALGDPGQLPPVMGKDNGLADNPDVFLRTIHRQAEGNPIIWASMLARQGRTIPFGTHGEKLRVIPRSQATLEDANRADQIIVCTHATRKLYNNGIRLLHGRSGTLPEEGEKLVCLKNDWMLISNDGIPMVNGTILRVRWQRGMVFTSDRSFFMGVDAADTGAEFPASEVNLDYFQPLPGREPDTHAQVNHYDFGYAITDHRSQGSEWPYVWFVNDGFGSEELRRQLLYTGLTRAAEEATICL